MWLQGVEQSAFLAQSSELLPGFLKRNNDTSALRRCVVTVADVDRTRLLLFGTNNKDEVVLRQLAGADLLLQRVSSDINIDIELVILQDLLDLPCIVIDSRHNRYNQDLTRADPERPLAAKVLGDDTQKPLETANDRAVNDNGAGTAGCGLVGLGVCLLLRFLLGSLGLFASHILELEVEGCLVVELDGGTLELSLESISNRNVDLRTVESTISFVNSPVVALELGHGLLQLLFGVVPRLELTEILFGTSGKLELKGEAEQSIYGLQEVKESFDFRFNLSASAGL